jgi:hypothetical protein
MPHNGPKAFHDGRLADFYPSQATASVPYLGTRGPEIRGDVDRRRGQEMAHKSHKSQVAQT